MYESFEDWNGHIKNEKNALHNEITRCVQKTNEIIYVICHSKRQQKVKKGYDVVNVQGGMSAQTGKIV